MSIVLIYPLITHYKGNGLSNYTVSKDFGTTLARFTLGNISNGDKQTYALITITDILSYIIMVIFYFHWKSFHNKTISQMEKSQKIINPANYALSVANFFD